MSLREQINQDLIAAMKGKDTERVSTLRFLLSAIKYREVDNRAPRGSSPAERDKNPELSDAEVVDVISKQVKTHKESIEAYEKGGRQDLVNKEKAELKILESYLPKQLSEEEVVSLVRVEVEKMKTAGENLNLGLVMKAVAPQFKGRAEGSLVKSVVEKMLKEG